MARGSEVLSQVGKCPRERTSTKSWFLKKRGQRKAHRGTSGNGGVTAAGMHGGKLGSAQKAVTLKSNRFMRRSGGLSSTQAGF